MRYAAAYALAVLGGNPSPDVAAIAKILGSVGIECNEHLAQKVIDACKGRHIDEIIAAGMQKLDNIGPINTMATTTSASTDDQQVTQKGPTINVNIPSDKDIPESPPESPGTGMVSEDICKVGSDVFLCLFNSLTYLVNMKNQVSSIITRNTNFSVNFDNIFFPFVKKVNKISYSLSDIFSNILSYCSCFGAKCSIKFDRST